MYRLGKNSFRKMEMEIEGKVAKDITKRWKKLRNTIWDLYKCRYSRKGSNSSNKNVEDINRHFALLIAVFR